MWAGMPEHNNSCGVGRVHDWASHLIEHELPALYRCPHGAGMAVVYPAWMEYVMHHDIARFARFAVRVFGCQENTAAPEETVREGIRCLRNFFRRIGMPTTFAEIGANPEDIPVVIQHRAQKPNGFPFGNFLSIGEEEMKEILMLAARNDCVFPADVGDASCPS